MNRLLKFRVWDKTGKVMINNIIINPLAIQLPTIQNYLDLVAAGDEYKKILKRNNYDPEEWIIQQFTGLTDKNGKEIYEGDILETNLKCFNGIETFNKDISHIVYYKDLCFTVDTITKNTSHSGINYGREELLGWHNKSKIIGNIFENSELLN